jgi:hypothetical protein
MTDPERISRRGAGLAAELLRASMDEEPSDAGMQRTLAALGASAAVLSTTSAAGAASAAASAKLTTAVSAGAGKAVSGALLVKWVGVGVVGGIGLAGAATLVTTPLAAPPPVVSAPVPRAIAPVVSAPVRSRGSAPVPAPLASAEATAEPAPPARPVVSVREPAASPTPDASAPLAAEVAYVDRARAQLASGQSEAGLAQLARYEREFPEARLLPEVLFLQLEAYQRLGRMPEARRAAERLVAAFPKSPHAARARSMLGAHFP